MDQTHYSDKAVVAANQNVKEREFWLEELSGDYEKTRFPYDKHSPGTPPARHEYMKTHNFLIDGDLYNKITKISSGIDLKLHMVLTAGLTALLEKYTAEQNIVIGSPILNQETVEETEFINTILVFRNRVTAVMTFRDLLRQTKETIVKATRNQYFSLKVLTDMLKLPVRDGYPLFDVALLLTSIHDKKYLESIDYNILFTFEKAGNHIKAGLEYNSLKYKPKTIEQIILHFKQLMETALADVNRRIEDLEILSEQEKQQVLVEFNDNGMDYPQKKTFHQLFEEQVEKTPQAPAVVGIGDKSPQLANLPEVPGTSETPFVSLTYAQLNEKANRLARRLRNEGIETDSIAAIMVERNPLIIIGVMAILKAGGAYLPVDPQYPEERIDFILKDSNAGILLTTRPFAKKIDYGKKIIHLDETGNQVEEREKATQPASQLAINAKPSNLAYVIYTSGSTGRPKGVAVQHNQLVNVGIAWQKEYRLQAMEVNLLQMASFSFDVFAGDIARTFLNGGKMVINPTAVVVPETLYLLIKEHRIALLESTPSYIIPFMEYVHEYKLEMENMKLLILGSDTCSMQDFKQLVTRFGSRMRVINSYGVTEATIDSSYYEEPETEKIPSGGNVPIGKPMPNMDYYVLSPAGRPQPIGIAGELYIGGAGVARGYLNRPELTAERFTEAGRQLAVGSWQKEDKAIKEIITGKNEITTHMQKLLEVREPFLEKVPGHRRHLYRTGDRARWLADGNMEFLGRLDYQVKVRGYRIELGEIESSLLKHKDISEAVVMEKEDFGDKYLCGYFVPEKNKTPDQQQLRDYLGEQLPEYMVPWFYVQMEKFPLTPNGKIDRKTLPEPPSLEEKAYAPPRDERDKILTEIWGKMCNVDAEKIGLDTNFFDIGGNSNKAIGMINRIHEEFNIKVSLTDLFRLQTIRELVEYMQEMKEEEHETITQAAEKDNYPLTPAQNIMYIQQQLHPQGTHYNIPFALQLEEGHNDEKIEKTFAQLIERHEALRTAFENNDGRPVQKIHHSIPFQIQHYHVQKEEPQSASIASIIKNFTRPFDLERPPLMRIGLLKTDQQKTILLMDIHHIIFDAVSQGILMEEFNAIYKGETLPEVRLQYKDYTQWQHSGTMKEKIARQETYWLKQFENEVPQLTLPLDFQRPPLQTFEGSNIKFRLEPEIETAIKKVAVKEGVTQYTMLLAIYYILLFKLSGREDIVVGTDVAGRTHAHLQNIVGNFVNTIALRSKPNPEKTFQTFMQEVAALTLQAFENLDYPFDTLVENVLAERDSSRNPLFDVSFAFL
ncbi:MAG: amino acid adenylation domain-containing protein, partial [bacterium]|nr:amino acid adenylation domain-containing protein [bacterium]